MSDGKKGLLAGETLTETLGAVIHKPPDWTLLPPDAPSSVRKVLERCLQKDRKQRMRDIGDVAFELRDYKGDDDLESVKPALSPMRWAILVPFVLLLIVGSYFAGAWTSNSTGSVAETQWNGEKLGGPAGARTPVVSPTGSRIAFAGWSGSQVPQVWVMEPGVTGGARQLTRDLSRGGAADLAWSRDGSRVFYSHYGTRTPAIWSVSAIGEPDPRIELDKATDPRPLANGDLLAVRVNDERIPQLIRYRPGAEPEVLPVLLTTALLEQAIRVVPGEREAVVLGRPEDSNVDALHLWAVDLRTYKMRRIAPDVTLPPISWMFPLAVSATEVYFVQRLRDLYQVVAVPLDGTSGVRSVITVTGRPVCIDVGQDGSLYLDQIDQPTEILRIDTQTRKTDRVPLSSDQQFLLPLPRDRFLLGSTEGEKDRLMVVSPDGSPVQFLFNVDEEARGPLARVGDDAVAFVIGAAGNRQIGIASVEGRLQRRIAVEGRSINGLSASPDGSVLYYVYNGMVYSVPSRGGPSESVYPGDQVAVDPSTGELVVMVREAQVRLIRVALGEKRESPIPIEDSEWSLPDTNSLSFTGGAVSASGRAVARIAGPGSAHWPVGVFDARSGGTIILPTDPTQFDMYSASWDREGRLVMLVHPFRSELWRFRPEPAD